MYSTPFWPKRSEHHRPLNPEYPYSHNQHQSDRPSKVVSIWLPKAIFAVSTGQRPNHSDQYSTRASSNEPSYLYTVVANANRTRACYCLKLCKMDLYCRDILRKRCFNNPQWNNKIVADRQANKAREDRGYTVRERIYTSAANRARRISEGRTATKAKWEADKCSKHYGYRLKGKAGSKRSVPMTSVKSLATRFYRLKSGHAPVGTYLKRFGHREDDKCWWCGSRTLQTREHLFRHCSRWKDQQTELWKAVGKATGWKAGRCRHVQISELFSMEGCDQAVMDFLAATDVGKFPPKLAEEPGQEEQGQG